MIGARDIERLIPTPGHTSGHQSLAVETNPSWVDRFAELDPWRVLFSHDLAIWERTAA